MSHHQGPEGPIDDQAVIAAGQQTPPTPPTTQRMIRSVLLFTVAGVILYGAAALASDRRVLWSALQQFPGSALFLTMILVFTGWLLRGWRFFYYLRRSGEHVPIGYSIAAFLAGFALTGTPGKVGEAVKGVFLKQDYGVAVTKVMGILVVERLMDLWGVLLLGSVSLLLFTEWKGLFFLCAVLVIAGGVFLCMESLYRPALLWIGRISFLSWISKKLIETLMAGRYLMTPRVFAAGLVLSTVAWGLESISFFIILDGFSLSSTILQANFVYCFSTLVGALSMLPGGIGGTEAGMIALLAFMGIPYGRALPAVILIRLCTLWAAIAVGVIFMVIMTMRSRSPAHLVQGNADPLRRMGSS
ncbi:MAG: lysylphosphatidylglycerol synthase transmembrane domain-containing protein [Thermodesulfobacteriota bacterium]